MAIPEQKAREPSLGLYSAQKEPIVDLNDFTGRPLRFSHASLICSVVVLIGALAWGYIVKVDVGVTARAVVRPYGETIPIAFRTTAELTNVAVTEGDYVKAGTVLARLDGRIALSQSTDVSTRLTYALGELQSTTTALALIREDTLRRSTVIGTLIEPTRSYMAALMSSIGLAQHDRDVAESSERIEQALAARGFTTLVADRAAINAVRRAELQLQTVRADGERDLVARAMSLRDDVTRLTAEHNRTTLSGEDFVIRAPVSGYVTALALQRPGQMAREGQLLLRILPDGARLVLDAMIPQAERGLLSVNQTVVIRFDGLEAWRFGVAHGQIANISPDVEFSQNGSQAGYHVLVRLDSLEADHSLLLRRQIKPGMTATIQMIADRQRALILLLRQLRGIESTPSGNTEPATAG